MRTTDPLNFRTSNVDQRLRIGVPNTRPIKFREQFPMALQDRVLQVGAKQADVACQIEMMQLFTCLTKKDFETMGCPKEIADLNSCWKKYTTAKQEKKKSARQLVPGANASIRDLTIPQINSLLRKYSLAHLMKKFKG